MNKRLFVTLSMAGLAMVAFGARKPKAAIKSSVKTVAIQQPTFTEWHDLQVNEINRLPLHTMHFAYDPNDFPGTGAEYLDKKKSMNYLASEKKKVTGQSQRFSSLWYFEVTNFQEVLTCQCLWWILFLLR